MPAGPLSEINVENTANILFSRNLYSHGLWPYLIAKAFSSYYEHKNPTHLPEFPYHSAAWRHFKARNLRKNEGNRLK